MNRENMKNVENYFEAFLIITLIMMFLFLIKDFLVSILFASTLVFLTYNFYQKILAKTKSEDLSAFLVLFVVLLSIVLPLYVVTVELIDQTTYLMSNQEAFLEKIDLDYCSLEVCSKIKENIDTMNFDSNTILLKLGNYFINSASVFFGSVSKLLINLFIFILAFFYLLKDGEKFMKYVKRIIPMKNEYKHALFLKFRTVTSAVFINVLLIAFIQGALVGLGFWVFGLPSPLFWGVIATFFALIPVVGAAVVWVPAAIYLFVFNSYFLGIAMAVYGVVVVSLSDNLLRPELLKNKIEVHPFLILLSIIGAIEVFGFLGVFLGPIFISLLVSILHLYNLDFK